MKILAVETATSWQSVAILDGERVLARCDQQAVGSHANLLLPTIDRLFCETGLVPARLDGLVVSVGPGSFTGLRVGLSTILGFRTDHPIAFGGRPHVGRLWRGICAEPRHRSVRY